jgi:putative transposase
MARRPRIHFIGAVYHVMLRGNGGQSIFFDPKDYAYFEQLIVEGIARYNYRIHGYCWMPNHVHMVVEVADITLSKIIQNISFRYTRRINKKKQRTGHLFQGRYKAILLDAENYLLELIRYIHLNPVRANLAQSPDDYPWSGHKCYLGQEKNQWLSTDWMLQRFSGRKREARKAYQRFVSKGLGEKHRKEFHTGNTSGVALGDEAFIVKIPGLDRIDCPASKPASNLPTISQQVCKYYQIPESEITAENRSHLVSKIRSLVTLLYIEQEGSISEVAAYFGKDISTLSRQVTKLKQKILVDNRLRREIEALNKQKNAKAQA